MSIRVTPEYLRFTQANSADPSNLQGLQFIHQVSLLFNPASVKIGTMYNSMLRNFGGRPAVQYTKEFATKVPDEPSDHFTQNEELMQEIAQMKSIEAALETRHKELQRLRDESQESRAIAAQELEIKALQLDYDATWDRLRGMGYKF